jgi:hypothetical protein
MSERKGHPSLSIFVGVRFEEPFFVRALLILTIQSIDEQLRCK